MPHVQIDVNRRAGIEGLRGSSVPVHSRFQLQLVTAAAYREIENTAERMYISQLHPAPYGWQAWRNGE
jgi:hypothetical protein